MSRTEYICETYSFPAFIERVARRLDLRDSDVWEDSSKTGSAKFTQTNSLAEAVGLLRKGWPEGAAKIIGGLDTLSHLQTTMTAAPAVVYDMGGEVPDVGLYCAGERAHMMTFEPGEERIAPVVRIQFDGCYAAKTVAQQVENQGIALLSCIDELERAGRSVELVWGACTRGTEGGDILFNVDVMLKEAGAHFDVDRAAFALAHPSMLRRMWFAIAEQNPKCRALSGNYGSVRRLPKDQQQPGVWYLPSVADLGGCYDLGETVTAIQTWILGNLTAEQTLIEGETA